MKKNKTIEKHIANLSAFKVYLEDQKEQAEERINDSEEDDDTEGDQNDVDKIEEIVGLMDDLESEIEELFS